MIRHNDVSVLPVRLLNRVCGQAYLHRHYLSPGPSSTENPPDFRAGYAVGNGLPFSELPGNTSAYPSNTQPIHRDMTLGFLCMLPVTTVKLTYKNGRVTGYPGTRVCPLSALLCTFPKVFDVRRQRAQRNSNVKFSGNSVLVYTCNFFVVQSNILDVDDLCCVFPLGDSPPAEVMELVS